VKNVSETNGELQYLAVMYAVKEAKANMTLGEFVPYLRPLVKDILRDRKKGNTFKDDVDSDNPDDCRITLIPGRVRSFATNPQSDHRDVPHKELDPATERTIR
jgi:hypothetical protein